MAKTLVVIVTHNSQQSGYLVDCLRSLRASLFVEAFDLCIVDNASTDDTILTVERQWPEAVIIKNAQNEGFAVANNQGFGYAIKHDYEFVFILNHDTVVEKSFLQAAIRGIGSNPKVAAVQSKLLLFDDKSKINSIGNEIHFLGFAYAGGHGTPDRQLPLTEITYPSGAATLFRVSALETVGFFNGEFFMYHEDTDLGWRFWLAGYRILLAPESVVYHKYQFSKSIKKFYYMERNRRLVVFQNYRLRTLLLIFPAGIAVAVAMLAYSLFSGWFVENLKVYWYFLHPNSWIKVIRTRRAVQKKRTVADREIIPRFVDRIEFQDITSPATRFLLNPFTRAYWFLVKPLIRW